MRGVLLTYSVVLLLPSVPVATDHLECRSNQFFRACFTVVHFVYLIVDIALNLPLKRQISSDLIFCIQLLAPLSAFTHLVGTGVRGLKKCLATLPKVSRRL